MKNVLTTLAFLLSIASTTAAPDSPGSVRLEIVLDDPQPLSQDLYGANTEALHMPVWFDEPALAEKYNAIGRPFVRFPGGTPSNFYNPQTGLFDNDSPSTREYGDQNKKLLKITQGAGLTPEPFFKFAREQKLRYSLVLNVCTRSFEENQAWLTKLAKEGHKIPAIEIGNEVFYGGYQWAFPKATDYLERARKLTRVIRKLFPGTKVAVVFPNQFYQDKNFHKQGKRKPPGHQYQWMKMLEGEDFYDALVIHLYSLTGMSNNTKPEEFIPHRDAYENVIAMLEERLVPTFDALETRFPGKELWITEYGVGGFGGNLKKYTLRYSHLGALHTDLMWLRFIQNPAVTIADWHSFNHFFTPTRDGKGFKDHEHLTFTHFSLFREPIRNSAAVVPVKFDTASQDLEAIAFKGNERTYLMLINKHGREHTLDRVSLRSAGEASTARISAGVQLFHRADMPLEQAMQNTERCERIQLTAAQLETLILPPYSITRLELNRQP
jgi:hypothetical protein